jgi:hypothetical protein
MTRENKQLAFLFFALIVGALFWLNWADQQLVVHAQASGACIWETVDPPVTIPPQLQVPPTCVPLQTIVNAAATAAAAQLKPFTGGACAPPAGASNGLVALVPGGTCLPVVGVSSSGFTAGLGDPTCIPPPGASVQVCGMYQDSTFFRMAVVTVPGTNAGVTLPTLCPSPLTLDTCIGIWHQGPLDRVAWVLRLPTSVAGWTTTTGQ